MMRTISRKSFILVSALWTLAFLSVLAVTLLTGVRQKIILLERIEQRAGVRGALDAGAKKAMAVLLDDLEDSQFILTSLAKERRMNNPAEFADIRIGQFHVEVVHERLDDKTGMVITSWGLADEQSKININTASSEVLTGIIMEVLDWGAAEAKGLASAIIDWRDYGQHEVSGFFSDDYYKSLEYPYAMKEKPFERLDELLLVKGVDRRIYEQLLPFVTIYGDGKVNINTASRKVLVALGLDISVADKVLKVRRGPDNIESTADDHVFLRTFDVAAETAKGIVLEAREARQVDELNARNLLTTESSVYSFVSRVLSESDGGYYRSVLAAFNALDSRILFWYEK